MTQISYPAPYTPNQITFANIVANGGVERPGLTLQEAKAEKAKLENIGASPNSAYYEFLQHQISLYEPNTP